MVADEIRFVMRNLGQSLTKREVEEIIRQGDTNGDGKLDYQGQICETIENYR